LCPSCLCAKFESCFLTKAQRAQRIAEEYQRLAGETTQSQNVDAMGKLAQLVAVSPFEAAVFDAYGRVLGANSFNLLSAENPLFSKKSVKN